MLIRTSEEDWATVLNINLKSVFLITKAVNRLVIRQKMEINLASVIGTVGDTGQANYTTLKANILGLTKTCARDSFKRYMSECGSTRLH
ncbi:SDR family oxidoreductase, partial [Listeria welshimeri]|nr:SDR family oxidoreductase [Listeria welshimeri]